MQTSEVGANKTESSLIWFNAGDWGVEGKGWSDTESYYDRLPARAKDVVRPVIWNLSRTSAGMCIHFQTDATTIHARWRLRGSRLAMPHMAATGVSGVDLYAQDDMGHWRWLAVGQPDVFPEVEKQLITGITPGMRQYRLYLPLYNGVECVEIGVGPEAAFHPVPPRTEKPIVFYGSSIVQGAAASRPGMHHPAILGRRLNKPIINLGFSGNAHMEPEIAMLLAELDPCGFVVDPVPNMSSHLVDERFVPFVQTLRAARNHTPIVLIEDRAWANTPFLPQRQAHHAATHESIMAAYQNLLEAGVNNLHLVLRDNLYGVDGDATVDGSHPTDAGFLRMVEAIEPVLRPLVQES